mgnify:CR=1 FL=1|tara:strand:+ start:3236 stop:4195 length:960 start_codon:yes stop_codon:yes gene_type:complete
MNFWKTLPKPFFVLAPMEDVTDAAFRAIIAKKSKAHGGTYVTFTEFISADGLVYANERGQEKLRAKLRFTERERPIVAQLFTATPKHMEYAAAIVRAHGFDGVDINMGCPDRAVEKQGAGSALIRNPKLAVELIQAAKRGAGELPVSVKTRIGYHENELKTWLPALLTAAPAAITIHARTRKEMSKVPAQWEAIQEAVAIRDALGSDTMIIGNGDVTGIAHAKERAQESGADGVMIGRGIYGNPWNMSDYTPTKEEKMNALIAHTNLFEKEFTGIKSFATMKKHFASYVEGFAGAKELRGTLMKCTNANQVEAVLQNGT